jgi:hypothetical protein
MAGNFLNKCSSVGFEIFKAVFMKSIIWDTTWRHIPEDDTLQMFVCPLLKKDSAPWRLILSVVLRFGHQWELFCAEEI